MKTTDEILESAGLGFVLTKDGFTSDVEEALRRLGELTNGADLVTRESLRSRTIEILKSGKVPGASRLVDAALQRPAQSEAAGQGKTIILTDPEPWPDPVNGSELLDDIVGLLKQFVIFPDNGPEAIALWVIHTFALEAAHISPILVKMAKINAFIYIPWLAYRPDSLTIFDKTEQDLQTLRIKAEHSIVTNEEGGISVSEPQISKEVLTELSKKEKKR